MLDKCMTIRRLCNIDTPKNCQQNLFGAQTKLIKMIGKQTMELQFSDYQQSGKPRGCLPKQLISTCDIS